MARLRENAAEPRWDDANERWILQVQIDGKRKAVTSRKEGRAGIQECKRKLSKLLSQSTDTADKRINSTWGDYLQDIIERQGQSSEAYRKASQIGRVNILPVIGNKKAEQISEQDLQKLLNRARKQDGSLYSRKSLMNIRGEINLFWKFLKKSGYVDWRPDTLEIPKQLETIEKNILQKDEIRQILLDDSIDPYLMVWQMMLLYGFRPGEVHGLQWQDITGDQIFIRRSINERQVITSGKNKNAQRVEYLIPLAKQIIERADIWRKQNALVVPWVFPQAHGEPIRGNYSRRRLHQYCKDHSLTEVTPYRLRHTFVSLAKTTLTETQIKMIVGHSTAMDTGIYMHRLDDDHIDTGREINRMFLEIIG